MVWGFYGKPSSLLPLKSFEKKILPLNIEGHIDQVFLVVKLVLHTNFIMYIN